MAKFKNILSFTLFTLLFCSKPAEASQGAQISTGWIVALFVVVAIVAIAIKKFME